MQMTHLARKLGRTDARLFRRDRLPLFMFVFIVYIAVVLRLLLPWANDYLVQNDLLPNEAIAASLSDFYPMIVAYMAIWTGALIIGTVVGFVMLDEKDHNTLQAMLVTPVPLRAYLLYRAGLPAILGFAVVIAMVLVIDQALVPLWQLMLIAAGAALSAPIATLFYVNFAANKVQGFAYGKFSGISGWIIMLGWFVPEPYQWLLGLFPPFWISKAYWMALEGRGWWWVALLAGVVLQLGVISWLAKRYDRVAYR